MKDWQRIGEVFSAAAALEPAARQDYLNEVCDRDEELRHEVESLLASHDDADSGFLAEPLPVAAGLTLPAPPESGEKVGSYRLIEKIGEGGMGTVYLAERDDGAFERRVAVKVLRRGMESDEAVRRFDLERRILAGLEHPGIARLLDGGTTAAGSPYVVMEHVEGERIDRYCDRRALTAEARVDLLLEVCDAVSAAHRGLVVHRDLKPSNVLVDGEGRPKLLDFGIAKILDSDPVGGPGEATESWRRVLTPSYASPEQVRGGRVTVATDVYLLGILLYKLLTGQLPHRFSSRSLAAVEAVLTTESPRRPSTVLREVSTGQGTDGNTAPTTPAGVLGVDSDLDHIVLKALRSDAAERYLSVEELAADLRRFRHHLPVRARQGSQRYRLRKFVQRHGRKLTAAGIFLALLTAFALDRTVQVGQRDRALARAENALALAGAVQLFLEDLFWTVSPEAAKGRELTVVQALKRGEEKLLRDSVDSPAIEASIHALFGRIRLALGQYDDARANLEQSLELFGQVEASEKFLRVSELRARGDLALALFHGSEDVEDETVTRAIAIADRVHEEGRTFRDDSPAVALELLDPMVTIYCWLGRWKQAAPLAAEAMQLARRESVAKTRNVAEAVAHQAMILKNLEGDLEGAEELYAEALAIYRDLEGPIHPQVANLYNQLGLIAGDLGEIEAAIRHHTDALAVRRGLYPDGHREISRSLEHLAGLFRRQERYAHAEENLREAVRIYRGDPDYGPKAGHTVRLTILLSEVLIESGQAAEAERLLRAELTPKQRAARPPGSRLIIRAEGVLGAALMKTDPANGERWLRESLRALQENPRGYEAAIRWLEAHLEK